MNFQRGYVITFLVFVFFVLLCSFSFAGTSSFTVYPNCDSPFNLPTIQRDMRCSDSDNGLVYTTAGAITLTYKDGRVAYYYDKCCKLPNAVNSPLVLLEYQCGAFDAPTGRNNYVISQSSCLGGCFNGRCGGVTPTCSDSDTANNAAVLGQVSLMDSNGQRSTRPDSCESQSIVKQVGCNGASLREDRTSCPAGTACLGGVCNAVNSCTDDDVANNPAILGTARVTTNGVQTQYPDTCENLGTLAQYSCSGSTALQSSSQCVSAMVCDLGICKPAPERQLSDSVFCEDIYSQIGSVRGFAECVRRNDCRVGLTTLGCVSKNVIVAKFTIDKPITTDGTVITLEWRVLPITATIEAKSRVVEGTDCYFKRNVGGVSESFIDWAFLDGRREGVKTWTTPTDSPAADERNKLSLRGCTFEYKITPILEGVRGEPKMVRLSGT